jgi:oligopeptide transport system substrate-binding protein
MRLVSLPHALMVCALVASVAFGPSTATASDRTLRVAFASAETSFDPAFLYDYVSGSIVDGIMESMLDYDYLARPFRLVPRTLEAMPTVENAGTTFTAKIRKGIFYAPDPAFKGKPRELTAADYAYGLKRILDPALKSPWLWMLEGKITGGDEARNSAMKSGRFDYDAALAGLEVVDRYTLKIRLTSPDLRFLYVLAVPNTAAVAREVVEAYGNDIGAHPVGTGPYMLGQYKRSAHIELLKNPMYREVTYAPSGPVPASSQPIAAALKGRRLPLLPRVEISIVEEAQARWLAFLDQDTDILFTVPPQFTAQALEGGKLKRQLAATGIVHQWYVRPNVNYVRFNMEDAVIGGYSPDKVALRRAISMAYNVDDEIRVILHGRAVPANGPVPPGVAGYDPKLKTLAQVYDPASARSLLDRFGYRDRNGDGYREMPDGKPLVLEFWSDPSSAARERDELWKKCMDAIGIRVVFRKDKSPEITKMARAGKIPMNPSAWTADYPDAENFMQLLYGPNIGQANDARFNLPEFNRLYEESRRLPDSPERTALLDRMTELVVAYAPWRWTTNSILDTLAHRWVSNYVPHPLRFQEGFAFVDINESIRAIVK